MSNYPAISIKKNRLASLGRRHPWIFSGAIHSMDEAAEGDIVRLVSASGEHLATGYYHNGSIAVRILTFVDEVIDQAFWNRKISKALATRRMLGLPSKVTNAFRLVHGEGDGVPGLVVDVYDDVAVIQCHTGGIFRNLQEISHAVKSECDFIKGIYHKSVSIQGFQDVEEGFIIGDQPPSVVLENGSKFKVDIIEGQKTGFFLDQRDNRQLVGHYAKERNVLNLYAYTGGFSIYSLNAGASEVVSVDSSRQAVELLEENVRLNAADGEQRHQALTRNVHEYIKDMPDGKFDLIILDPPAFAKSQRKRHNAVQAYKRINAAAMSKIRSGGLLFTFSCSQVVDPQLFYHTVTAAAMETGRPARVLHRLSQGPDHPVNIFHPEGEYLKGLVLEVD